LEVGEMSARGPRHIAWAMAALACASAPEIRVERCPDPAERLPRPAAACFAQPEAQRYSALLANEIADSLSGHRSYPGSAGLSVAFAPDTGAAQACFDTVDGKKVARRIVDAAERIQELPPAPACFAGHRLDFAWESDVVTGEDLRLAVADCRRRVERYRRKILFILEAQTCPEAKGCSGDSVRQRWNEADRELRSCVLDRVPLVMRTGVGHETLVFDPAEDTQPDPAEATRAAVVCDRLPHRSDVVECMERHGWEPRR
jgi:hypothetical protein